MQDQPTAEHTEASGKPQVQSKIKSARRRTQPLHTEWSIKALTPAGSISEASKDLDPQPASAGLTDSTKAPQEQETQARDSPEHHSAPRQQSRSAEQALQGEQDSSSQAPSVMHKGSDARTEHPSLAEPQQLSPLNSEPASMMAGGSAEDGALGKQSLGGHLPERNEGAWSIEEKKPWSTEESASLNSSPTKPRPAGHDSSASLSQAPMTLARDPPASSSSSRAGPLAKNSAGDKGSMRIEGRLPSSSAAAADSVHGMLSSRSPSKGPSISHFSVHTGSSTPDSSRSHVHRYSADAPARSDSATADKQALLRVSMQSILFSTPSISLTDQMRRLAQLCALAAVWRANAPSSC